VACRSWLSSIGHEKFFWGRKRSSAKDDRRHVDNRSDDGPPFPNRDRPKALIVERPDRLGWMSTNEARTGR